MDISVIVPIYNVEQYVERCLRSLFTQTKTIGVEYILVNDCSTDDSMYIVNNLLKEFPSLTVKIINKNINQGLAAARISGLKIAVGEYIMHVDSDDWCEQDMLEELYDVAKLNDADLIQFDHIFHYSHRTTYSNNDLPRDKTELLKVFLYNGKCHNIWSKFIKRELYSIQDTFFYPGVNMGEDYIASCKLLHYSQKLICVPKAYMHYECTNYNSLTKNKYTLSKCMESYKSLSIVSEFLEAKNYHILPRGRYLDRLMLLKYRLLYLSSGEQQKKLNKIWSNLNSEIFKSKLRLHYKVVLYLASVGHLRLCNIVFSIFRLLK